jgi:hypothetical protein
MDTKFATTPPLDSWQSALDDVAGFRDASPQQHCEDFVQVCRLASAIQNKLSDTTLRTRYSMLPSYG